MRNGTLAVGALVFMIGAALAPAVAGAQVVEIDPVGPSCIEEDDSQCTYQCTVITDYNFDFLLKVYKNGVLKSNTTTSVTQSGPSYSFSKVISFFEWNLSTGDIVKFFGKATLTSGPYSGSYDWENLFVDCSAPGVCFRPANPMEPAYSGDAPCALRDEENA